ncbi:MAG: efflux RND transporter periplasmic adaptor subunit [Erysipelotrichaceae bacterium]|nr:efflux RND transporter periplasmic adaptor subunit [Erysipelotrichaceae bacterium]
MKKLKDIGSWITKHKLITVILVVLLGAGSFFLYNFLQPKKDSTADNIYTYTRTVSLFKGTLDNTISATGTIESQNVSTVSSSLRYTVKSVNVDVGDYVSEGDTIVILDSSDIQKEIDKQLENSDDQYQKLQDTYYDAEDAKNKAKDTYNAAYTAMSTAESAYNSAKSALDTAESKLSSFNSDYNNAKSVLDTATTNLNSAMNDCLSFGSDSACSFLPEGKDADEYNSLLNTYTSSLNTYNDASSSLKSAESALNTAKSSVGYTSLEQACTSAQSAYEQAKKTCDTALNTLNDCRAKEDSAYDAMIKGVSNDTLSDLYDQLDECTLKAKSSGTITSLNATVGSTVSDNIATIQDTNKLKVSINVDEYDINSVSVGMNARITSDAIDEVLDGRVSSVSAVANSSSMGSTASTFAVTVEVTSTDIGNLKIGMSVEVEIILSSIDDVYTVPIDAVGTNDFGESVVYAQDSNGDFYEIVVNTGETNDYYIEISSSELSEGMKIRAAADENATSVEIDTSNQDFPSGFNIGGSMPCNGRDYGGGGQMP